MMLEEKNYALTEAVLVVNVILMFGKMMNMLRIVQMVAKKGEYWEHFAMRYVTVIQTAEQKEDLMLIAVWIVMYI